MNWQPEATEGGVRFYVRVVPRARKSEVSGLWGEALKVRVAAPPVEGAANEALVNFLAERLSVRRAQVRIVSGQTSREKVVEVQGLGPAEVKERLLP
ncbi:MAG: DUF167 domain-containing protein [Anaerolineae bacterium]